MTQSNYISGQGNVFKSFFKGISLVVAAIFSVFLLATSFVVAFILIAGLVIVGLIAFAFFWTRAKITGKPFGPKAHFEKARADMEAQFKAYREKQGDGPIIDAQRTPDGWSVED